MPANSTPKRCRRNCTNRPDRPYPEFPLSPHGSGYWSKRVRGRLCYFGKWAEHRNGKLIVLPDGGNWRAAYADYKNRIDDLQAGRTPRMRTVDDDGLTLAELGNKFLNSKYRRIESGELSPRTFREYKEATDLLIAECGSRRLVDNLQPEDFELMRAKMAKQWGPSRVGKFVQMIRTVFKFGADNGLIVRPVLFGSVFKKPSKAVMRRHKAASGKKLFTLVEVRMILDALDGKEVTVTKKSGQPSKLKLPANPQLKAIVLLGLNAGLGNTDISSLQFSHLSSDGWLNYPRPKTGLPRRVPLWEETLAAIKAHRAKRRDAKDEEDDNCVFLNRAGRRLVQTRVSSAENGVSGWGQDYVSSQFRALLRELSIDGRRGLGFYSLRHTFATIALQSRDRDAVRSIMGHAAQDMLSAYDETGPSDERLIRVVQHVHDWLFTIKTATDNV